MNISFDFDKTLTCEYIQELCKRHIHYDDNIYIVTSRLREIYDIDGNFIGIQDNEDVFELALELGINSNNIYFTNQQLKLDTLVSLDIDIHYDDDSIEIDDINRNSQIKGILIEFKQY